MSFDDREKSADDGSPIELFDFYRGYKHWRYTNADRVITYGGYQWLPVAINRGALSQSPELKRNGMKLEAPRTIEVYEQFRIAPPGSVVGFTLYSYHYGEEEGSAVPEWTGVIVGVVRKDSEVEFVGEPAYASLRANGLRRKWQIACPHLLYGPGCRVVKESWRVPGTVIAISGLTVTVSVEATYADYYFEGGFIEWYDDLGLSDYRGIERHEGSEPNEALVQVSYTLKNFTVGQEVNLYPGCNHTMQMCNDRFNNVVNYGGTPYIPQKNPYKGQPVY